ncbi:MAG: helix-turn-helix transcriptional regulator [Synergistaceae bacterium]|nr:helix-turn-helix transcriptional regulator [Candidatus Equadaptatus faecalis]
MSTINERIKQFRSQLHLSQEYVANFLGINRASFSQLENGNRKLSADELAKLCELFGVSSDFLLSGVKTDESVAFFARSFEKLDENDQAEIMNLIRFKEQMKAKAAHE